MLRRCLGGRSRLMTCIKVPGFLYLEEFLSSPENQCCGLWFSYTNGRRAGKVSLERSPYS